jgi:AcrR family transcriptional regulator
MKAEARDVVDAEGGSQPLDLLRTSTRYPKLKPRRNHDAQEVGASQRARLSAAIIELVDEGGYRALTVRGLTRRAGVSTRAFYEHFTSLEGCFISVYELLIGRAVRKILGDIEDAGDQREHLGSTLRALAREIAAEPSAARFVLIAAPAAGPEIFERTRRSWQELGAVVARCLRLSPGQVAISPLLLQGILAGVARVPRRRLLDGREEELPELAEQTAEWVRCFPSKLAVGLEGIAGLSTPMRKGMAPSGAEDREHRLLVDERAMILAAAAKLGARDGYDELSVPRIRTAAGVSRKSFDAQFADLKDCFLAALELRAEQAFTGAVRQSAAGGNWPAAVHSTLAALCARIAADPARAKVVFVEVLAAGEAGVRCRARLIGDICEYVRERAPAEQRPGALAAEASAAAVWSILHDHVATGKTQRLPMAAPTLSYLVLAPAIGPSAAVAAIGAEYVR